MCSLVLSIFQGFVLAHPVAECLELADPYLISFSCQFFFLFINLALPFVSPFPPVPVCLVYTGSSRRETASVSALSARTGDPLTTSNFPSVKMSELSPGTREGEEEGQREPNRRNGDQKEAHQRRGRTGRRPNAPGP